jgi:uncharacterized heparinase superfamily protein
MSYLRLLRTLRHLQHRQLGWRCWYVARRRWELSHFARFSVPLACNTPVAAGSIGPLIFHEPSMAPAERVRELQRGHLTLLGVPLPFRGGPDWRMEAGQGQQRLWAITLHYHEWLADLAAAPTPGALEILARLLWDWLETCQAGRKGFNHFAWNSYAIATRLGAWVRLYHALPATFWPPHAELRQRFVTSFAQQALYLERHLEWDVRGNHLLRDAVGLAWAGRFFTGVDAQRWLRQAEQLGLAQAREQVLADGCHFERSPMYHLHALGDIRALAELLPAKAAQEELRLLGQRMAEPAAWLRHPDGGIPLFNDAALNGAVDPAHLLSGGSAELTPRRGGRYFEAMGMVVWHGEPWSVFYDVGPIGPDYQPGHAHADTLSLECSYRGQRFIVDPGTYHYDRDERRRYDRGTAAHNTVALDGQDSSEVWHIFRVGRRAYPRAVQVVFSGSGVIASAAHTGYDHLPGRPRHTRQLVVDGTAELRIVDRIEGDGSHRVQGGFLLGPGWTATPVPAGWLVRREAQSLRIRVQSSSPLELSLEMRSYHPSFGVEIISPRLCWQTAGPLPLHVSTSMVGL